MKILIYLFRSSPVIVSVAIVMSFVSGLGNASLVALAHTALSSDRALAELGLQFALLTLGSLSVSVLSQLLLSFLYRKAIFDWQVHMSEEILKAPLRHLEKIGEDNISTVLMRDVSTIGASLLPLLPQCSNVVVVVCCLAYLCWLAWQPFVGTLLVIVLGLVTYRIALQKNRATLKDAREESSALYGHFRLLTNGIKELKLHRRRRRAFIDENLRPSAASIQKKLFRWSSFYLLLQTWSKFLLLFVLGMVLFIFPTFMSFDSRVLSGYIVTLLYVRGMLTSIMSAVPSLARANIAYSKIESLGLKLSIERQDSKKEDKLSERSSFKQIQYKDITHTYYREREDSHFTLGPISLTLKPGEIVYLVGGNGSGKTTLAKLLTGLYTPESGEIYVDGELITDENREQQHRSLFSVVFADFQLFNELLGIEAADIDARAKEYLVK
ncbi:MAG: cyclic peptide export ABC transporter, partial [Cyanobacteria bacterium J06649_4]